MPSPPSSPLSQPLDILLAHNQWANRKLFEVCAGLADEQLDRRFEMGPGSLRATLTHIVGTMRAWGDLLAGRETMSRLETDSRRPIDDLLALHAEAAADLEASARANPVDEVVSRERGGKVWRFTRGMVVTHVTTHGVHHRAQCINMLRRLGVETLPDNDVIDWMLAVDWIQ